jgi:hypothetical protein
MLEQVFLCYFDLITEYKKASPPVASNNRQALTLPKEVTSGGAGYDYKLSFAARCLACPNACKAHI